MRYLVIAACIDARSGAEFEPGEEFLPEPDFDQAERLMKAGCLRVIDGDAPVLPVSEREGILVAQLRAEIATLTDDLATTRSDAGKLLDAATADIASARGDRDQLTESNAGLVSDNAALTARVADLEAQIAAKASAAGAGEQQSGEQAPEKPAKTKG